MGRGRFGYNSDILESHKEFKKCFIRSLRADMKTYKYGLP